MVEAGLVGFLGPRKKMSSSPHAFSSDFIKDESRMLTRHEAATTSWKPFCGYVGRQGSCIPVVSVFIPTRS